MSKVTIDLTADLFARLLQSALDNNETVGGQAKAILAFALQHQSPLTITDKQKVGRNERTSDKHRKRASKSDRKRLRELADEKRRMQRKHKRPKHWDYD